MVTEKKTMLFDDLTGSESEFQRVGTANSLSIPVYIICIQDRTLTLVRLHAGQVDRPKYLPDRTSKLKHIQNDCLFVISWHFNLPVISPKALSGSLLKSWNQLCMLNVWANHSKRYQCLWLFSQHKVDCGWLVTEVSVHVLVFTFALPPCACVSQIIIQQTKTPFFIQRC